MTTSTLSDETFRTELTELLAKARRADVTIRGVWTCDIPGEAHQRWNVEITLATDSD